MPQSLSSLIFHFVFSTQHRRAQISREIQPKLYKFIAGILRSNQSRLLAAGGMPDLWLAKWLLGVFSEFLTD